MGEVIRKTAATADILADVRTVHSKSMARPGTPFVDAAETHLTPVLGLIDGVERELTNAIAVEAPLGHALEVADEQADAVIGQNADLVWNAIGRPQSDAAYSILFPGGISGYVDASVLDQPIRMELLVKLLRSEVHPKLPPAIAEAAAAEIEAAGAALDQAVENVRRPRARVKLYEMTLRALGRAAAVELARMKRLLLARGLTEAQIHEVIPDRGRSKPKSRVPAPSQA
ncbi:MAG: hypothetical protein H5U40_06205 [Polyangiaceae bacterium]|nr:hypothetical protein [Polyangiaceae bacterium]